MGGRLSSGSFWTGPFLLGLGLLLGVGLGFAFYTLGGLPRDHDAYGEVSVPGQVVLALPEGDVRLNFENHATQSGDSSSIDDQPEGLEIRVAPAGGGPEVKVEDVPSWIFSSVSNDRGHEPKAKADIPSAGDYLVQTTDAASGAFPKPVPGATAAPDPPKVDSGPAISVGKEPWAPLGSPLVGGLLVGLAILAVIFLFSLPFRLFGA